MPVKLPRFLHHPYILLTTASFLWAGNSIVGKLAVGQVSPMAMTFLRWAFVGAFLVTFQRGAVAEAWTTLRPRWRWVVAMGVVGYTAFNALLYMAAHHTSGLNLTILQGSLPIFIMVGGLVAFGSRIHALQALGVVLTLVGIAVLASAGDPGRLLGLTFNIGDLFMILACILYAGYTQGLRRRPAISGLALFSGFVAVALVASAPLVGIEMALGAFQVPTPFGWLLMVYITVGPSFLSQLFYMRGVEMIGPARAGIFINLVPVFGALMAVLILGEPFGLHHAMAVALVFGGILLAELGKRG